MPRFKIILTSDYEVWGDGSGCVERCVIEPTEQILSIAEKYNARVTFFFDVCEYWAFKEVEENNSFIDKNYKPATLIENQLKDVIKRGFDVQLHFHPQWLNYKLVDDHKFELDFSLWRISSLELGEFNKKNDKTGAKTKSKSDYTKIVLKVLEYYRIDKSYVEKLIKYSELFS